MNTNQLLFQTRWPEMHDVDVNITLYPWPKNPTTKLHNIHLFLFLIVIIVCPWSMSTITGWLDFGLGFFFFFGWKTFNFGWHWYNIHTVYTNIHTFSKIPWHLNIIWLLTWFHIDLCMFRSKKIFFDPINHMTQNDNNYDNNNDNDHNSLEIKQIKKCTKNHIHFGILHHIHLPSTISNENRVTWNAQIFDWFENG